MDKRYQVFLSSTFADLEDERKEVLAALQKAGYFVAGMELFPSDDDDSWVVIKRVIDQSDYYVLVVGGRYGSIGNDGKSFTEMEYDYAKEKKLPVLAFLHSNPESLPSKHVEREHVEELEKFKKKIEKLHTRRSWTSKHDLTTEVLASISQTVNLRPGEGWVRGNIADKNTELLQKLEELRSDHQKIRDERDRLAIRLRELAVDQHEQIIAWGDDEVEISVQVRERKDGIEVQKHVPFTMTWSRIFDLIARKLVVGWVPSWRALEDMVSLLREELESESSEDKIVTSELTEDSLETIRNQLLAMELIFVETEMHHDGFLSFPVEKWRLSERGVREHSQKRAKKREA